MPSPSAIFPVLEGLVGTTATGSAGGQEIGAWVRMCKVALTEIQAFRDATGFLFVLADDVDQTANVIDAAGTFFNAILIEQDASDAERDWVVVTDADSNTFDGTAALDNDDILAYQPAATATNDTPEYAGIVVVPQIVLGTGLSVGADGRDGADPAADDIRCWILYR